MTQPPSGTVTFLFTDLESSTRLWEERTAEMQAALAEHDARFRAAIEAHHGYVVKGTGDGFHAAFGRAGDAVQAAAALQAAAADLEPISVRIGILTGEGQERDGDYFGPAVNRASRLTAAGHAGQVLIAGVTAELVSGFSLRNLGEHRLRDLGSPMLIWQLGTDDFPPLRTLDELPGNLPVQLTSFVGRGEEVQAVAALVAEHRLVTLTGVGGVGKTRLATQAAAEVVDAFADGVWLVELASIDAPRVVDTIARALRLEVRQGVSVEESLVDAVRSRQLLMIFDNCEHVLREVRRVTDELLRVASGVSIVATSREGLRVAGEQLYAVPSLDDDAASELFRERARASDATFAVSDADDHFVAELCTRLDGVPLAIELAAARARMFGMAELASRVEQRFRLLTGGRGDVERHQTLRAAIDWSYDLLDPSERLIFARLSVFVGGGTLDALEAIAGDEDDRSRDLVFDVVAGLVDKSLVNADRSHAESRYEMLETIRQYAQERLVESGEAEAVRARHARWYADFARRAGRGLYSADDLVWDGKLRPETGNLQIAVGWAAAAGETDIAMRIGGSFPRQAVTRPLLGTAQLAEIAMSVDGAESHSVYARVLAEAGWAAAARGDEPQARALLDRSVEAQRNGARFAAATYTYLLQLSWHDTADRLLLTAEGLALAEASGDRVAEVGLRAAHASTLAMDNQPEAGGAEARRALDDARELRMPALETAALFALAQATFRSDPEGAHALLRASLELARRHNNEAEEDATLMLLAHVEARLGDGRQALETMRERVAREAVNEGTALRSSDASAPFYLGTGAFNRVDRPDLVAMCEGNTRTMRSGAPNTMWSMLHDDEVGEARAVLGDEAFEQHAARGAALASGEFNAVLLQEIDSALGSMAGDEST